MRKVIAAAFVSLDGVMQAPGGPDEDPSGGFQYGGWTAPYFDESVGEAMGEIFERPYDLLLGRKTWEIFAAHWPYAEEGPDAEISKVFNRITKYVATRSDTALDWANSVVLHDAARDVASLKAGEGSDLMVQGSSVLLQTLHAERLIDEISLLIFPLVLGRGKRFFGDASNGQGLRLVNSRTSPSGVTINRYVPDGEVKTGSFALEAPSAAELARRDKMKHDA